MIKRILERKEFGHVIIQLENVSLKRDGKWILRHINWQVKKGEHWVIYGLNGAGKTALLNLLNGYFFPTEGKVKILEGEFGKVDLREYVRRKIGLVSSSLQERFYGTDSAYEIVLSGAFASIRLFETPTDGMRTKAKKLLQDLGCMEYADRPYRTLSQGEKQRILIARALMNDPRVLILDEPANALDFIAKEQLLEAVEQIASLPDGPVILYVTHQVEEILPVFEKALLLKRGEIFAMGKIKEIFTPENLTDFLGLPVDVIWSNDRPLLSRKKEGKTGAKGR